MLSNLEMQVGYMTLFFERMVNVPRIMHGNRQSIDTLINEEALLFAKYLRHEIKEWQPRIVDLIV